MFLDSKHIRIIVIGSIPLSMVLSMITGEFFPNIYKRRKQKTDQKDEQANDILTRFLLFAKKRKVESIALIIVVSFLILSITLFIVKVESMEKSLLRTQETTTFPTKTGN